MTAPTAVSTPAQSSAGSRAPLDASESTRAGRAAEVVVSGGLLEVRADNSSLNLILRALAERTGMQITGGVVDQRVFGTYGPGPVDRVLSELLEGTGTNMILRQSASGGPGELILSPRLGGPSPPSPKTYRAESEQPRTGPPPGASGPMQPQMLRPSQKPLVPPLPFSKPAMAPSATDPMQTPVTPDPQGIVEPPVVAPATEPGTTPGPATQTTGLSDNTSGKTNPGTSDAPKTPQQIYEELQQLRQQQQQSPPQ